MSIYKYFQPEQIDGASVCHLVDADFFDRAVINDFQEEMINFILAEKPDKLLIDFGRVRAISSETINALLRAREYMLASDGQIKLCDMREEIRQAFRLLNLEGKIFDIHDSMAAALESF